MEHSSSPMSQEQLRAFIAHVGSDKLLQEKLRQTKDPTEVVNLAKTYGYSFSEETIKSTELNDDELIAVAGGENMPVPPPFPFPPFSPVTPPPFM